MAEVTMGAAVAFFVIWLLVGMADRYATSAAAMNLTMNARNAAARLEERLSSEASSSWAVFVPQTDVLGFDDSDGHEVDFFSEDGSHRPYAWAYRFDAKTKTVTRYSYAPGVGPQSGETLGPFDGFTANEADASNVASPASALYDPLFANVSVPTVRYTFAAMPSAQGGNGIVELAVSARGVNEKIILASAAAPTSFTVVLTYTPAPPPSTGTPAPLPSLTPTP